MLAPFQLLFSPSLQHLFVLAHTFLIVMLVDYDTFENSQTRECMYMYKLSLSEDVFLKKLKQFLFQRKTFLGGTKDTCLLGLVAEKHVWSAYQICLSSCFEQRLCVLLSGNVFQDFSDNVQALHTSLNDGPLIVTVLQLFGPGSSQINSMNYTVFG